MAAPYPRSLDFLCDEIDRDRQFGMRLGGFAAIAMLAPSRAARNAIARPMPRLPPVMNKALFARLM
jgi:hypothetical protein